MGLKQYTKPLELYDAIEGMRSDGSTIRQDYLSGR